MEACDPEQNKIGFLLCSNQKIDIRGCVVSPETNDIRNASNECLDDQPGQ